jgi:hypothetical protein
MNSVDTWRQPSRARRVSGTPGLFVVLIISLAAAPALAANIQATLTDGLLTLVGDGANNQVVLSSTADGALRVSGQNGTTVNGGTAAVSFRAPIEDVDIRTGGGADLVIFDDVELRGLEAVTVDLGAGNDRLRVVDSSLRGPLGDLIVTGGSGADTVIIDETDLDGALEIRTGSGRDIVELDEMSARSVAQWLGGGPDESDAENVLVTHDFTVVAGGGSDDVELLWVTVGGTLDIQGGGGEDEILTRQVTVDGDASLNGGAATDIWFDRGLNVAGSLDAASLTSR